MTIEFRNRRRSHSGEEPRAPILVVEPNAALRNLILACLRPLDKNVDVLADMEDVRCHVDGHDEVTVVARDETGHQSAAILGRDNVNLIAVATEWEQVPALAEISRYVQRVTNMVTMMTVRAERLDACCGAGF